MVKLSLEGTDAIYKVLDWNKETHNLIMDINDIYFFADWARKFSIYRSDNDVNDPLKRGTIAFYQMYDLHVQWHMPAKLFQSDELGEAIGSLLLHTTAALEMCEIDVASYICQTYDVKYINEWANFLKSLGRNEIDCYKAIAKYGAGMLRQLLYKVMNRHNRYNVNKLLFCGVCFMEYSLRLSMRRNVNVAKGIQTAMGKLHDNEFVKH